MLGSFILPFNASTFKAVSSILTIIGVKDFGAFVEFMPGKEGLVHISELADFRVESVGDICKMGDTMWVKCLAVDQTGKVRLSRKAALAEMDEAPQTEEV